MRIDCKCQYCGKEFKRQRANIRQGSPTFCSRECYSKSRVGIKTVYKGQPKKLLFMTTCAYCNSPVVRWNYAMKSFPRHFCNNKCKGRWMSLHLFAERSTNWRGGRYSTIAKILCNTRYRKIREVVLVLDNYTCQLCGEIQRLEVHHIIEKGKNEALIFDITNMITLCKKCHCSIRNCEEDFVGYFNDIVAKRANSVETRTVNTELNSANFSADKCVETIYSQGNL